MLALLLTDRLLLRPLTAADLDPLHALDRDPAVMRYINGGLPVSREAFAQTVLPVLLAVDDTPPGFGFWGVETRVGDFLGWVSLRPTGEPGEGALGYRFRRVAWGHGYATEAAAALLDRAFASGDLQRIVATTYEDNTASIRVMERLGMALVRRFRYAADETPGDTAVSDGDLWPGEDVLYAVDRSAWVGRGAG